MSQIFIPLFFPDLEEHESFKKLPKAFCADPGHVEWLGSLSVRWPYLAPLCILGFLVGAVGAWVLYSDRRKGSSTNVSWIFGFLFFALMNVTALVSHCLLPDVHARAGTVWRALDVGCTGAASVSCMHAAASAVRQACIRGTQAPQRRPSRTAFLVLGLNLGIVGAALLGNLIQVPWTNEIIYIALTLLCVPVVGLDLTVAWRSSRSSPTNARQWMAVAVLGLLLCAVGQPLESWLCSVSASSVNAIHALFLGCDVIFLGLAGYLQAHNRVAQQQPIKRE